MNGTAPRPPRKRFIDSLPIGVGLGLLVFGSGPLICMTLAANVGLYTGPWKSDPIPFGIISRITFFPGLAVILGGIIEVIWNNWGR